MPWKKGGGDAGMRMPLDAIDPILFAPCGMNCMVCYRHCQPKKPCEGCLKGGAGMPSHCRACRIKNCVREKGLSYCHACREYPCGRIRSLDKSYRTRYQASLIANGLFVREHGVTAFLERQKRAYTCIACGGVVSLHDGECSECRLGIERAKYTNRPGG